MAVLSELCTMNRKIITFAFAVVLLSSFVFGANSGTPDRFYLWEGKNISGVWQSASGLTISGTTGMTSGGWATYYLGSGDCGSNLLMDTYYNYVPASTAIRQVQSLSGKDCGTKFTNANVSMTDYTIVFNVTIKTASEAYSMIWGTTGASGVCLIRTSTTIGGSDVWVYGTGGGYTASATAVTTGNHILAIEVRNVESTCKFYVDGNLLGSRGDGRANNFLNVYLLGQDSHSTGQSDIHGIRVFTGNLGNYPQGDYIPPVIASMNVSTNLTPSNGTQFNTPTLDLWAVFNVSYRNTSNFTFYIDQQREKDVRLGNRSCYQPFANVSTICGAEANTSGWSYMLTKGGGNPYGENNMSDGDWNTFGVMSQTGYYNNFLVNYSVPTGANLTGNMWVIKTGNGVYNLTIPTSCYDNNGKNLLMYYNSAKVSVSGLGYIYCKGSVLTGNVGNASLYETAIYWNMTDNSAQLTDINISYTKTFTEGQHNISLEWGDNETALTNMTSTIYIDSVSPTISYTNLTNNTKLYTGYQFLDFQLNVSDEQILHSLNISFNGTTSFYINTLTTPSYNQSYHINLSNFTGKNITGIFRIADGHTAKELKDTYEIEKKNNRIKYKFKGGYVEMTSSGATDTWDSEKKKDRYSFKLKQTAYTQSRTITLDSNQDITIVNAPFTTEKKWVIVADKWIDFSNPYIEYLSIVQGSNSKQAIITFDIIEQDPLSSYTINPISNATSYTYTPQYDLTFNSIGELNIINYYFNVVVKNISEPYYQNITYSNYTEMQSKNLTRDLRFYIDGYCLYGLVANLSLQIDNVTQDLAVIDCPMSEHYYINTTYKHTTEGNHNISFYMNVTNQSYSRFYGTQNFTWDLFSPRLTATRNVTTSFGNQNINLTIKCADNVSTNITYFDTFNAKVFVNQSNNTGITFYNQTNVVDGANVYFTSCTDQFDTTNQTDQFFVYYKTFRLIDEVNNTDFEVTNISQVRAYFDDNSTYYDFRAVANNSVNFTTLLDTKIRFELLYPDGAIITRYIDVRLTNETEVRVCANRVGVTHYDQIIYSTAQKPVLLLSKFANCYVVADYTRFAYQDALAIKAYTIERQYDLYTFDTGGSKSILTGVEGSLRSEINLDSIEYNKQKVDLSVSGESLLVNRYDNTTIIIRYYNINQNNKNIVLNIYNNNNGTLYYTTSDSVTPNDFTLYFDYVSAGIINRTPIRIEAVLTRSDNSVHYLYTYDIPDLRSNTRLSPAVAFVISVALMLFGISFLMVRLTFSWFGILITISSMIVLGIAEWTWYTKFLLGVEAVVLLWIIVIASKQNYVGMT